MYGSLVVAALCLSLACAGCSAMNTSAAITVRRARETWVITITPYLFSSINSWSIVLDRIPLPDGISFRHWHDFERFFRIAFTITHGPQFFGSKFPHLPDGHLLNAAFGYDPRADILRIFVDHHFFRELRVR